MFLVYIISHLETTDILRYTKNTMYKLPLPEKLARAYVVRNDNSFLEYFKDYTQKNPDVVSEYHIYDMLSVDDARDITRITNEEISDKIRCIVISCDTINTESQNTLLKTFEEVPATVSIFFICTSHQRLLSTLLSRCQKLTPHTVTEIDSQKNILCTPEFFSSNLAKKLVLIDTFLKPDERTVGQMQHELLYLYEYMQKNHPDNIHAISEIGSLISYLNIQGSSPKLIFHYIAHLLP